MNHLNQPAGAPIPRRIIAAETAATKKKNSGDYFAAREAFYRHQDRKDLHPCGIPAADWKICHARCYLRSRCWAAIKSDLRIIREGEL